MDIASLRDLSRDDICRLPRKEFKQFVATLLEAQAEDRRENDLLYYKPVSDLARQIHLSTKKTVGVFGGNGSSKTETCLVDMVMLATGIIPMSLRDGVPPERVAGGPFQCRVVCESLTTVMTPIFLPKLQWFKWTGLDSPGGKRGHWGWVPREHLIDGQWEKSWSEKLRILRIKYFDPLLGRFNGESTIQFMSTDQDSTSFASGDFHRVLHDEPPTKPIWTENEARTMRVNGRMFLAMTWPDDPAIPVAWIHDDVYDPGTHGDPNVECFELFTTHNMHLNQEAISIQSEAWDEDTRNVRIYGRSLQFSNLVHPLFTDQQRDWCFDCGKNRVVREEVCTQCGSQNTTSYCHVDDDEIETQWPTLWLLDPHPRKPHRFIWAQIDPSDDIRIIADGAIEGDCSDVFQYVDAYEKSNGINVTRRIIDPSMARQPSGQSREVTWQDEFEEAGLRVDRGDNSDVGRKRLNQYLKPDPHTLRPRITFRRDGCQASIKQLKRYVWEDYKKIHERAQKQKARDMNDDFPDLLKYLMNTDPSWTFAVHGRSVLHRPRKGQTARSKLQSQRESRRGRRELHFQVGR